MSYYSTKTDDPAGPTYSAGDTYHIWAEDWNSFVVAFLSHATRHLPGGSDALLSITAWSASAPTPTTVGQQWYDTTALALKMWNGSTWVTVGGGTSPGTVTSVSGGNGMNFTTITVSGPVTLGTPSSITSTSTNAVTTNSHTHAIDSTIALTANIPVVDTVVPIIDGTATIGTHGKWADGGHIHPTDTSRAADSSVFHKATAGEIDALTVKTTPVSADEILIEDSAASFAKKKILVSSLISGSVPAHAPSHLPSGTDPLSLYPITTTLYIDGNRVDTYTADGSISKPYKTIGAAVTASTGGVGYTYHISTGTYSEAGSISFPNVPIVIYGNDSTVTWSGGVTVQNSNFARYDLNSIGAVVYAGTSAGRVVIQGGSLVGNVTINTPVTDLKSCTLSSGIVTIASGAICLAIACTFTSRIVQSGGTLFIEDSVIDRTDNTNFLVTSTSGQLVIANSVLNNHGSAGCISCNNGATTLPNAVSNNFITVSSGAPVACGTAVTIYSKNIINGTNTGVGYIPITSDIIGPSSVAIGSDATGDIYYRNSSGVLTRLPIGTSGYVLQSSGTIPQWVSGGGAGTVTSVASGNGMNFTTITGSGTVTMGTPGSTTSSSTNVVTTTSHTHAIDTTIFTAANGKSSTTPIIDGTATIGATNTWADGGHIHPTDTSRSPVASPTFTGTVTIPSTNDSLVLSGTPPPNGSLLIGDGTGFRNATITAGTNITVTNGTGTISIAASGGGGASMWTALTATTDFATTAPSTSTITMNTDQTANIKTGYALKLTFNTYTYYAQVTAITSSLLTFRGPPITTGAGLLTAVSWGDQSRIKAIPILMPGYYEAATATTYINSNLLSPSGYEWELPSTGYCVGYTFQTATADGSSDGKIQLVVNGNNVCSTAAAGITASSTSLLTTGVAINVVSNTNITIIPGQYFEISVTKGTVGDATNGRLTAIFVVP